MGPSWCCQIPGTHRSNTFRTTLSGIRIRARCLCVLFGLLCLHALHHRHYQCVFCWFLLDTRTQYVHSFIQCVLFVVIYWQSLLLTRAQTKPNICIIMKIRKVCVCPLHKALRIDLNFDRFVWFIYALCVRINRLTLVFTTSGFLSFFRFLVSESMNEKKESKRFIISTEKKCENEIFTAWHIEMGASSTFFFFFGARYWNVPSAVCQGSTHLHSMENRNSNYSWFTFCQWVFFACVNCVPLFLCIGGKLLR